jgi:pimeloyl-ACP methyl ester carboxylesterase
MGWETVVNGISEHVRVCIYNRRGVGGSDQLRERTTARTSQDQVDDLVGLIDALDLETPIILVGHSIAGFNIRLFSDQYPDLLAGAVFVDASHPDMLHLIGATAGSAGPVEYLDVGTSAGQVRGKGDMGDKPLVVLTAGRTFRGEKENQAIWVDLHRDHATLSTNARHEVLGDSGHEIFAARPDAIIDAVLWIIDQLG